MLVLCGYSAGVMWLQCCCYVVTMLVLCGYNAAVMWLQCLATDTVTGIAAQHHITVSELKKLNRLMSDLIYPGKVSCIETRAKEINTVGNVM